MSSARDSSLSLRIAGVLAAALALTGCTGSSAPAPSAPPTSLPFHRFLKLPVATPTSCPSGQQPSAAGRLSPWAGRADLSIYLRDSAGLRDRTAVHHFLDRQPRVRRVFFESQRQAYAEYQRLYTCSANVSPRDLRASYRVALRRIPESRRNDLVRELSRLPAVGEVVCDPVSPCNGITPTRH